MFPGTRASGRPHYYERTLFNPKASNSMEFLASLEHSSFCTWVRESGSVFAYPGILFLHTLGLAMLVGPNAVIDLRILGVGRRLALNPLKRLLPLMWTGFWINAITGTVLLISDASTKLANPAFIFKMVFIAFAVVNVILLKRFVFNDRAPEPQRAAAFGKVLAVTSLLLWSGAITSGRLMAYFGQDSGAPELINHIGGGNR